MAETTILDVDEFEKDPDTDPQDPTKYIKVATKRPRYWKNDIGPLVRGDNVVVIVKVEGVEVEKILYRVRSGVAPGKEIRMVLSADFVEMKAI